MSKSQTPKPFGMNVGRSLLALASALLVAAMGTALLMTYPGHSKLAVLWFYASGCVAVFISLWRPSSFFVFLLSSFLFVGFIAKAIANFVFGVALIEPISTFTTEWDQALAFAASGFSGVCAAGLIAALYPAFKEVRVAVAPPLVSKWIILAFGLLIAVSSGLYWANYSFHILRIGYPLGIDINPRLYAVAAFVIAWGALLGGLTLTLWLVELRNWSYSVLIYVAVFLGLLASVSMGSRIQLLLYVLAAFAVIVLRHRDVSGWIAIAVAMGFGALVFAGSLAVVSLERTFDFSISAAQTQTASQQPTGIERTQNPAAPESSTGLEVPSVSGQLRERVKPESLEPSPLPPASQAPSEPPTPSATTMMDKVEAVRGDRFALDGLYRQLRNLAIMRWVGLEGTMTSAANVDRLGTDLFVKVIREDPAAGAQAIYQKMSGDRYGKVQYYTFLTLPGPIGVASLSGSLVVVSVFMFLLTIVGHSVEWMAARTTRNVASAAVTGVSLAYLLVQMGFPWTLFIYAIELALSVLFLGAVWYIVNWLASRRGQVTADV
ncbi:MULTISPECIES: hypothetical protein [unclassified Mesorhizobium]|uniref:hypothetical protein n=1 Tax=unclassified Mesorhizobium TaxID=325217 RepID=UPI000FCC5699|nr:MULTISPECIES: hypothetical protein [unclassified Mesorhizobium]RUY28900.1 hypothetical protein EN979_12005 [Mesorhizobium sp. M7A.F.Ca.US.001.04.2.1]RUY42444.1 hypothetical protein EN978_12370 [Mesorhizobium sp. M7A.F.Ca.US.001.04.1.1]RVA07717.1 hypothetical protein EN938_02065 [Mesorhizobium sp. M7A.F.Ca.US.001.02.1.1]RVA15306.1 hypothetical protein EN932_01495 [Mesorhizobium sp. M7A.F.Ca.US.002.01.1.1]